VNVKALLVSALSGLTALALVGAGSGMTIPRSPNLPPGWSHASINVVVKRRPHTLTYDRGRVQAVTATSVTLKERDGSVWTINVSPAAKVTIDGRPAPLTQIRPREMATTVAIDGGAAVSVKVQIPAALAAQFLRQAKHQGRRR
jgi:hypothetical protein